VPSRPKEAARLLRFSSGEEAPASDWGFKGFVAQELIPKRPDVLA
jgi:hypothetical protein